MVIAQTTVMCCFHLVIKEIVIRDPWKYVIFSPTKHRDSHEDLESPQTPGSDPLGWLILPFLFCSKLWALGLPTFVPVPPASAWQVRLWFQPHLSFPPDVRIPLLSQRSTMFQSLLLLLLQKLLPLLYINMAVSALAKNRVAGFFHYYQIIEYGGFSLCCLLNLLQWTKCLHVIDSQ